MNKQIQLSDSEAHWFAVRIRARQEMSTEANLQTIGVQHYLPVKEEVRQWSDRKRQVKVPLFSGYTFVRIQPTSGYWLQVLKLPGVLGFVGNATGPLAIPDQQIEDIRTLLAERFECDVLSNCPEGTRVRVRSGALAGLEGTLVRYNSMLRLVVSIETIDKSLAIVVSREDVELLPSKN